MAWEDNILAQVAIIARDRGWLTETQFVQAAEEAQSRRIKSGATIASAVPSDRVAAGRTLPDDVRLAAEVPSQRLGKYVIVKELGRGGFGTVAKAWQTDLGRYVAIKLLRSEDPEELPRFLREAQVAAGLSHPNIVPIHEIGEHAGKHYIAMEYIAGDTLARVRLAPREAAAKLRDAALAVEYAHGKGVVHRDLKPANLMLDESGRMWVMDFGLARRVEHGTTMTASGMAIGTPAYMSPEQARGDMRAVDARSDIYSLGATLYELLASRPPFEGQNVLEVLTKVASEDPAAIPGELGAIAAKAMEKDPAKRYASMKAFTEDLRRFLDGEPIMAKPAGLATRLARKARRYKAATALICVLAAAVLGLAAWTTWRAWALSRWIAAAEAARDADEAVKAADAGLRLSPQHPRLEAVKSRALAEKQAAEAAAALEKRKQLDDEIDRARRKVGELSAPPPETGLGRPAPLPPSKKEQLWNAEDQLADRKMDRKLAEARAEEYAQVALRYERTNTTAISVLGRLMYERWEKAETERDARSMQAWADRIDRYDPDRRHRAEMEKRATLELKPEPGDAEAWLFRYEERGRQMIPLPMNPRTGKIEEVDLPNVDPLPLTASEEEKRRARERNAYALAMTEANRFTPSGVEGVRFPVELAAGSYLVVFRKAGYVDTRYPVLLERGKAARARVELAREEEVPPGFVYVPEGPYLAAYDREAQDFMGEEREPHETPVAGFCIARFAVTCGEYLEYLNDRGEHPYDAASAKSPRAAQQGGQYWRQREGDRILMRAPFAPDWPVFGISWNDAKAYAAWVTKKRGEGNPSTPLGVKWRFDLPSEEEWEKAAGGVLRWVYPWGDRFDNGFARIVDSRGEYTQPEAIGLFPADESPYGLRDGGGVMRTWTRTARVKDAYITKGGVWSAPAVWSRACIGYHYDASGVGDDNGVRLVAARAHP